MSVGQLVLEYVKVFFGLIASIAWPAGVVWLVFHFRAEIKKVVPRLRRLSPTAIELDPIPHQDPVAKNPEILAPPTKAMLDHLPSVVRALADKIQEPLEGQTPQDQRQALVIELAYARLATFFENTYGQIFGSQLRGLRRLQNEGSVSLADAEEFYQIDAVGAFPEGYRGMKFENWMAFLVNRGLVLQTHDSVKITDLGREFLAYLTVQRLPDFRPL